MRPLQDRLRVGASGYAYAEWKGSFYPEKIDADAMLAFYAQHMSTVEINNTFYRMPKASVLEGWAAATPPHFRFAIKASRRITHDARIDIDKAGESIDFLYRMLPSLGDKLAAVLFQLPPFLKKDVARLTAFLSRLPQGHRAAIEFRHESWFDDEVYAALRAAGAALVLSEREDNAAPPLVETAPFGYLRLRLEQYGDDDMQRWAEGLQATGWNQVFVYFMHEPTAPGYAKSLTRAAGGAG
jgi:uncharacterized protein YecE (DUF72 family)